MVGELFASSGSQYVAGEQLAGWCMAWTMTPHDGAGADEPDGAAAGDDEEVSVGAPTLKDLGSGGMTFVGWSGRWQMV